MTSTTNNNNTDNNGWGKPPFQRKAIPGMTGFYVYTQSDYNYWMHIHKHLTAIHERRVFKEYKMVEREQVQLRTLTLVKQLNFNPTTPLSIRQ